jgi:hypothetical protein
MERFKPLLALTLLPGTSFVPLALLLMLLTCKSSTNTYAWFLLIALVALCTQSRRQWAILVLILVTRFLAFLQLALNLVLRLMARCALASCLDGL